MERSLATVLLLAAIPSASITENKMVNMPSSPSELSEFSSQARPESKRPRIRIQRDQPAAWDYPRPGDYSWPGPGAVRQCVDWYATEYRPSGVVVTPQMRCRWVRG